MANISPLTLALGKFPAPNLPSEVQDGLEPLHTQLGVLLRQYNIRHGVLQSPNGHYWRISVSNVGALTTTDLGTVLS